MSVSRSTARSALQSSRGNADHGLFGPGSVTWRVHLEPVLWVAGLRALLLQALHPRVMRGTFQNSALFDPEKAWPRFLRTVEFVGIRTFGSSAEVHAASERVRRLHSRLRGYDPDTRSEFRIDEPAGLLWVHCAEIDSYVDVARRAGIVDDVEADTYVRENVRAAEVIGLPAGAVPVSRAQLQHYFTTMRPHLAICDETRHAVRNLLAPRGQAPIAAELMVGTLATLAITTLPRWARRCYGLPGLPTTDLGASLTLRALRRGTQLLPDVPSPPHVERARTLIRTRTTTC